MWMCVEVVNEDCPYHCIISPDPEEQPPFTAGVGNFREVEISCCNLGGSSDLLGTELRQDHGGKFV